MAHPCGDPNLKNLLPLFLMGSFPVDFQEVKRPLRTKSGKRPIKVGKRPIKVMVLVSMSVGCLMGCFRAPPPWWKTAPLKRPMNWSMTIALHSVAHRVSHQIPADSESEMPHQNRATTPKSRCRTFLRTPLSHFPLICSRQGAKGDVAAGCGGYRVTFGFRKRIALHGGCRSYSHTSRATLCN